MQQYFAFDLQRVGDEPGLPNAGSCPISGVALNDGVDSPEDWNRQRKYCLSC